MSKHTLSKFNKVGNKIQQRELETDYNTLTLWCYFRWNCLISFLPLKRSDGRPEFTEK